MANIFNGRRFVIDTPSSSVWLVETLAPGHPRVKPIKIDWVGATTAGHQAVITDSNDRLLWKSVASGANFKESELVAETWDRDFKVPTLGSGELVIDIEY